MINESSSKPKKPRVFAIDEHLDAPNFVTIEITEDDNYDDDGISTVVIEYSALTTLQARVAELEASNKRLLSDLINLGEKLFESDQALKLIADTENCRWSASVARIALGDRND